MDLQPEPNRINPGAEDYQRLQKGWLWFLLLGIVVMVVGMAAVGSAFIATIASVLVFGILMMTAGGAQVFGSFLGGTFKAFVLHLLLGIIEMMVGALMIAQPTEAAAGLTLMLAAAFLVGGAARLVFALAHRFEGRAWVVVNGLITFLLGVAIWRQWPESSLWVIGLFIGINLVFSGWSWVMLAVALKAAAPARQEPTQPGSVVSVAR